MTPGNISIEFILACLFVGSALVLGFLTLFVQAENIERNILVGLFTLTTALIGVALLQQDYRTDFQFGTGGLVSISVLAVSGFAIGRIVDAVLGPMTSNESTIDADLAK